MTASSASASGKCAVDVEPTEEGRLAEDTRLSGGTLRVGLPDLPVELVGALDGLEAGLLHAVVQLIDPLLRREVVLLGGEIESCLPSSNVGSGIRLLGFRSLLRPVVLTHLIAVLLLFPESLSLQSCLSELVALRLGGDLLLLALRTDRTGCRCLPLRSLLLIRITGRLLLLCLLVRRRPTFRSLRSPSRHRCRRRRPSQRCCRRCRRRACRGCDW